MAMELLKIFGTKYYYFTIYVAKRELIKMNIFFYLKAEKAENLCSCISDLENYIL